MMYLSELLIFEGGEDSSSPTPSEVIVRFLQFLRAVSKSQISIPCMKYFVERVAREDGARGYDQGVDHLGTFIPFQYRGLGLYELKYVLSF